MRVTRVRALGWEDPLEKEMAIHSSTLAWKIPWTKEPGRLQSMGSQRVGREFTFTFLLPFNSYMLKRIYVSYCDSDDEFQLLQRNFMDKYYQEFEDTEENKLTYTPIFNEYVSGFLLFLLEIRISLKYEFRISLKYEFRIK